MNNNPRSIGMLEEKLKDLQFELTLPMDETVKEQVVKELENTYKTIQFFKELEPKGSIPWNG